MVNKTGFDKFFDKQMEDPAFAAGYAEERAKIDAIGVVEASSDLYNSIIKYNGQLLDKKYIMSLSEKEREDLIEPLFIYFRELGWMYPKISDEVLKNEYKRLVDYVPDLSSTMLFNNSSIATKICKYFCNSFYLSTERNKKTMIEAWNDDDLFRKLIRNRLALNWTIDSMSDVFSISYRMMIQGMRSMRLVPAISIFKPDIAKYICMKYSEEGDVVGDYSAGFGGRLLGAVSCGRKYFGMDPLTVPELIRMVEFFDFKNVTLLGVCSENYHNDENILDLVFSSPPYYDQEFYNGDKTQAYNNGKDYFYIEYWGTTLRNMRYMLKPGKWFGVNVKNDRMLQMAIDVFGEPVDKIGLRTVRSHLNKTAGIEKAEYIYMFRNLK